MSRLPLPFDPRQSFLELRSLARVLTVRAQGFQEWIYALFFVVGFPVFVLLAILSTWKGWGKVD
ncbi:MAG: hypothetical protein QF752_02340 [Planctomycetota bacterium]|nr:hypothetical protein [Planctomycetota bacterium]